MVGVGTGSSGTDARRRSVTSDKSKVVCGIGGTGFDPEPISGGGYSACRLGALKAVARGESVKIPDEATIDADVSFGDNANGPGFAIAVELKITIPGIERSQAEALVEKAHQICPYSNATRGNVDVTLTVL